MSKKLHLTLAMGDYEIVRALKEGKVEPDGIELTVLTDMDSTTRHWRFLRNEDFDVAEVSCSSYLVARDQGMPFEGLPVFLHRRFRHGFIFINTTKGIEKPTDLIGRKVGLKQYQSSAQLWMRGFLEHDYGVPHRSIEWYSELDESIDFKPPPDLKLHRLAHDKGVEAMLAEGELDAVLHPDLIKPLVQKDPRVGRLFPNFKEEEIAFYKKTKIFPIMHVIGIRREIVEKYPWVPINLYHAFNESKAIAMKRMVNPRIVPLAWYRETWEEQEQILGPDPWEYGMTEQNEHQLKLLVQYSHEQGMIGREIPLDELFVNVLQGRKRGDEFRM
ncbi:MAG: ABC transporter substrate-binding protein [Alphaproteobacteria bacterium]|jgi:4,5-dihydroxyphthalate decarboxylase|nr:ABC transporter substrate-binding protein [Alphaproteobacteria bacterium]